MPKFKIKLKKGKKLDIKYTFPKKVQGKFECPNCREYFDVYYDKNRWVEFFKGECWTCGYKFLLKDKDFDKIQPQSPFFEMVYKYHPDKLAKEQKKQKEIEKYKHKEKLEKKYHKMKNAGKLKSWDLKSLKRIVLNEEEY